MGKDVESNDGEIIPNHLVTGPPEKPMSYAFCSDTAYYPEIIAQISNTTVLYHESTFLEANKELAAPTKHSTAIQAAQIAKDAKVEKLILGHFSTRYPSIQLFKEEALTTFPNVELADDGKIFTF
jgi:ribonuclease Z